ncbi:hypothetical protein LCGC14_2895290, partial [marine sediment metagenome]
THAGALSVLSGFPFELGYMLPPVPDPMPDPMPPLVSGLIEIQFDNAVAGLLQGYSASAKVIVVWDKLDGSTDQIELPITIIRQGTPLFKVFDGLGAPAVLSSGTLTMEQAGWTPSAPGTWAEVWDETHVFHAQFDFDDDNPNGIDWRVKVSKGGGLYSVELPGLGEIMPPQNSAKSPWNDDTCTATLLSNENNTDWQMQGYGNGFVHQVGMYVKPWFDPLNNKPQYSPLFAEKFDAASSSYSVVNLGLCPSPSVNRADVLFYMKYRHLGSGVIEITFYFYNYGDFDQGRPAVPWTGVRGSVYPEQIRGVAGGGFELFPYSPTRRYDVDTSGGWIGHSVDYTDNNSPAYSLLHGIDKHYGESGYEDKWDGTTMFTINATSGGRDFKVM